MHYWAACTQVRQAEPQNPAIWESANPNKALAAVSALRSGDSFYHAEGPGRFGTTFGQGLQSQRQKSQAELAEWQNGWPLLARARDCWL